MNMISIKSDREIELMRRAGALTSQARALAGSMVKPGVSTLEIDHAVRDFIRSHGAEPSFLNYSGYPGSACISINEVVIHGIPDHRKLLEGISSVWMWAPTWTASTAIAAAPLPAARSALRPDGSST